MRNRAPLVVFAAVLVAPAAFALNENPHDLDRTPDFGWVLVSNGSTIATSLDELNRLDKLNPDDDRVLFARFGEGQYLIHDRSTLDRVERLVEPIRKLSERARALTEPWNARRGDKLERRAWKERLRAFKEKRRDYMRRVSPSIEDLARDAVWHGRAQRVN